jgi:Holliday junction DNA helicase RuvA
MITKMTGTLVRVLDEEIRLRIGPFEYQVLIPETVRRQLQNRLDEEVSLHIMEYLEGAGSGNRFVPRRIGFLTDTELELFELLCSVEKIGVKKALKAMAQPVRDIADAISRQDVKWLSSLPGIGLTTAEQIVAALKRKAARLALGPSPEAASVSSAGGTSPGRAQTQLLDDLYQALLALGHSPLDARQRLDSLLASGKSFTSVEQALTIIYGGH